MERIFCLLIGYGLGCFLTAAVVTRKTQNASVFEVGSKNPGMANVAIEYGKKPAAYVFIGDALKVIIACLITHWLFKDTYSWTQSTLWTGLGCTLGHNYPIWHHLKGGEGVMTSCTTIVFATPLVGIISILCGGVSVLVTQFLNLGAVIIPFVYTIIELVGHNLEYGLVGFILTCLSYAANRHAIIKIGTENEDEEKTDIIGAIKKKKQK